MTSRILPTYSHLDHASDVYSSAGWLDIADAYYNAAERYAMGQYHTINESPYIVRDGDSPSVPREFSPALIEYVTTVFRGYISPRTNERWGNFGAPIRYRVDGKLQWLDVRHCAPLSPKGVDANSR